MKYITLIICFLMAITTMFARGLKFERAFCDFGEIKEDGGPVSHEFKFRNSSNTPIVITGSSTSCGCTVPTYSRKPIMAGEESSVTVRFDPLYRPGINSKTVLLYTSEGGSPIELEVRAKVLARERSIDEQYPYKMGGELRVSGLYVTLGNISHGESRLGVVEFINTSKRSLSIELRPRAATQGLIVEYPKIVAAGERGVFNIGYDIGVGSNYYGSVSDIIDIYIDSQIAPLWLQSKAYIVDFFSSNIKKGSPSALFTKKIINFDTFNLQSGFLNRRFTVDNKGLETLVIRKVESPEFLAVRPVGGNSAQGCEIKGRGSVEFEVLLDSKEFGLGANVYYITLILNSPEFPVERLKVIGRCEEGIE